MRLGCVSWAFRGIGQGPPWDDPIATIGGMGFSGIELIVARAEEFDGPAWKEQELERIRSLMASAGLVCSQFVLFQSAVAGLGSRVIAEKRAALRAFEAGCGVAKKLGSRMINMVAPWPTDVTGPNAYLPRYYAIPEGNGAPPPSTKFHLEVPAAFPARQAWDEFVAIMREATAIAKDNGVLFSLENHTHTFVPTTDAFLRLYDRINDPTLGMNLDIGWIWINREYPPLAIYKVADLLLNVHIRDVDGLASHFPAVGTGRMDLPAVIRALRAIGYRGYLTIEQDNVPDQRNAIANGRKVLEKLLAESE
jgi:sugar phosphate isomerase/epimerase